MKNNSDEANSFESLGNVQKLPQMCRFFHRKQGIDRNLKHLRVEKNRVADADVALLECVYIGGLPKPWFTVGK